MPLGAELTESAKQKLIKVSLQVEGMDNANYQIFIALHFNANVAQFSGKSAYLKNRRSRVRTPLLAPCFTTPTAEGHG